MRVPSRTCASAKARIRCRRRWRGTKVGSSVLHTYAEHGARATRSWAGFRHHRGSHRAAYIPARSGRSVLLNNNYCFETSASSSKKYGQGGKTRNLFDSFFHNNQSAAIFLGNNPCSARPNGPLGTRIRAVDWCWECCDICWRTHRGYGCT